MSEQNFNIPILFEDNQILVVVKPVNIPTNKDESEDADLLDKLKEYIKVKYQKPGEAYIGMVHRLDRPTGGVMLFARTSKAAERLSAQIRERNVHKTYLAVVEGVLATKQQKLTHYLLKDATNNQVEARDKPFSEAKEAVLSYKVLQERNNLSLLEIELETGRSHQIRSQMSHIGHPVVGDAKYGSRGGSTKSLALWAFKLEFSHPVTKEQKVFQSLPNTDDYPWNQFDLSNL